LQVDPNTHKVVDTLLPWYVNGALESDERELVRAHLESCSRCREEAKWLRDLQAACAAVDSAPGSSRPLRELRRHLGRGPAKARWAVAASLVSVGIVVAASAWLSTDRPAFYRTLGAATVANGGSLVVVFDPATPEKEMRRILRDAGAHVVDGPT